MEKKRVLEILRMTNHNGPGFRTLVLFKGCPQRCYWCSTPESQACEQEIGIFRNKCAACGRCVESCPEKALCIVDGQLQIDRTLCTLCGECIEICPRKAIRRHGIDMTVQEIVDAVARDKVLFKHSGGGVTFSGGEPLFQQTVFNLELFQECRKNGINVGVQTCGSVPWNNIEPLLPHIDFFLWDLKQMDTQKHRLYTGLPNETALENCRRVSERGIPLYLRVPIIPGYTDNRENLLQIADFVKMLPSAVRVDLMPMHHLGKVRYEALDRVYPIDHLELISQERMNELCEIVSACGIPTGIIG